MRFIASSLLTLAFALQLALPINAESTPAGLAALPLSFAPDATFTRFRAQTAQSAVEVSPAGFTTFARSGQRTTALRFSFAGGADEAALHGEAALPGRMHDLRGSNPAGHRANVETFGRVRAEGIYPGIDVVWRGTGREIEYDFIVAPGADPGVILVRVEGADRMELDTASGAMRFHTADGVLEKRAPTLYQDIGDERRAVRGRFVPRGADAFSFAIGDYDPAYALVIDPLLVYGTFLGGNGGDAGRSLFVNAAGEIYVAGLTDSGNFPTTGGSAQPAINGTFNQDLFIAKFNAAGTALVYCTYLGGTNNEVFGAFTVDGAGAAYLTGRGANSANFPRVTTSYVNPADANDAFLVKLNPAGTALVYSVLLGSGTDPKALMVDATFNAVVAGATGSASFPTTPGAFNRTPDTSLSQAFVTKINPGGTALVFSTLFGNLQNGEGATGVAQDSTGAYFICGSANGLNPPATTGAFQTTRGGGNDAFVAKLSFDGGTLNWATLLGGGGDDQAVAIAVDAQGRPVVLGNTNSTVPSFGGFPTTPGALRAPNLIASSYDVFLACLAADGRSLVYSTLFGSNGNELAGPSLRLDAANNATFGGTTASTSNDGFPATDTTTFAALAGNGGSAFLARVNATGTGVLYATRLAGAATLGDPPIFATTDVSGAIYATGFYLQPAFYTTPGAFRTTANAGAGGDAFVIKLDPSSAPPPAAGRLANISIRANAGTGSQTLIMGIVVGGPGTAGPKPLLIRGSGPALGGFGLTGTLPDPVLTVFSGTNSIATNDDWANDAQVVAQGTALGAFVFPAGSRDAALVSSLAAGSYTVQVTDKAGASGIALAEIYDATPGTNFSATTPRLINVSARLQVGTGGNVLIAGFAIGGGTPRKVLIRAAGPALTAFGVGGSLADPQLELFSGSTRIDENDNWSASTLADQQAVAAFPFAAGSRDAVLVTTLPPGAYTAQVSGVGATTGVALVEIYELP